MLVQGVQREVQYILLWSYVALAQSGALAIVWNSASSQHMGCAFSLKCLALQVSVNDFIVRAVALALKDVPAANARWDAKVGAAVPAGSVDVSIAVATDKGLITPIVAKADTKSLSQISAEARL